MLMLWSKTQHTRVESSRNPLKPFLKKESENKVLKTACAPDAEEKKSNDMKLKVKEVLYVSISNWKQKLAGC